jgi:hypothetical protein
MKNIAYIQNKNTITDEQIIKYMGNIKYLTSKDPQRIYKFIVCCNKCYGITNFCLSIISSSLEKVNLLIENDRNLDNCIFVATYSSADYLRDIVAKNIYFSLSSLSVIIDDYLNIDPYNIMTIVSDDPNTYYDQLYLEGPKPAYRISDLTVEKVNEFVDNGNALNLLIALNDSPVNEYETLNKILLDPACKYVNFATFLELQLFDIPYVDKLRTKLVSITNIASNVSLNALTELYPAINDVTLYDICAIQLVKNYNRWPNYINKFIIFNRFSGNTSVKEKTKKSTKTQLLTSKVAVIGSGPPP